MIGCCLVAGERVTHNKPELPSFGEDYATITEEQIAALVADPPERTSKQQLPGMIPSTYHHYDARSLAPQLAHGEFAWLTVDADEGNLTLPTVVQIIRDAVGAGRRFYVYSTWNSWNPEKGGSARWRVLIPLRDLVPGRYYKALRMSLADRLDLFGLHMDQSTRENLVQIAYTPSASQWGYQFHIEPGVALEMDGAHPILATATEHLARMEALTERNYTPVDPSKHVRFIDVFNHSYPLDQLMLECGYTPHSNGKDWQSPLQAEGSGKFSTIIQPDGTGLFTLSGSDAERGLGTPSGIGRYVSAFDLFKFYKCGNDHASAMNQVQERVFYGIHPNHPNPVFRSREAFAAFSYEQFNGLWCGEVPVGPEAVAARNAALEEEAKEAKAHIAELEAAEENKWRGPWLDEVPFNLANPSRLEWLAWHAPNVIGHVVRERAPATQRFSLVPLMLGAVGALGRVGQGKFVGLNSRHVTPVAVMIFQVGSSGSGKSDGTGTYHKIMGLLEPNNIKAKAVKTFASGQSLSAYLSKHPDVFMLQNEGGSERSAGRGNSNFESLMAGVTDAYTAFEDGIDGTYTKSDDKDGTKEVKSINHPTVGALSSSTPKKLFQSISTADGESGWLGRNLFIPLPNTLTNKDSKRGVQFSSNVAVPYQRITDTPPPIPGQVQGMSVWAGKHSLFYALNMTEEAEALLNEFVDECDAFNIDMRRGEVERAIYGRAAEAVNRLATVVGLGHWGWTGDPVINKDAVWWATQVVRESIAYVTSHMENMVDVDEDSSVAGKVRSSVRKYFDRASVDTKFRSGFGTGHRLGPDGEVQLSKHKLKVRIKDNTKAPRSIVQSEIEGMIEDGELIVVAGDPLSAHKQVWLKYLG